MIGKLHCPVDAHHIKENYGNVLTNLFFQISKTFRDTTHSVRLSRTPLSADEHRMCAGDIHIHLVRKSSSLAHLHVMLTDQYRTARTILFYIRRPSAHHNIKHTYPTPQKNLNLCYDCEIELPFNIYSKPIRFIYRLLYKYHRMGPVTGDVGKNNVKTPTRQEMEEQEDHLLRLKAKIGRYSLYAMLTCIILVVIV